MSATDVPVDVDVLRDEIRKTYTDVSTAPGQDFIFVANHWLLGRIDPGSTVLDLGCGAGTDLLIAAQMTVPQGRVIGSR
jgi:ubiquinone/menaquinone biosynthesis C-methylase UbiE